MQKIHLLIDKHMNSNVSATVNTMPMLRLIYENIVIKQATRTKWFWYEISTWRLMLTKYYTMFERFLVKEQNVREPSGTNLCVDEDSYNQYKFL